MTTFYRHQELTTRCDLCLETGIERLASESCARCDRPLCDQHGHSGSRRCGPCEEVYSLPVPIGSPFQTIYFWVPFCGLVLAAFIGALGRFGSAFALTGLAGAFGFLFLVSHAVVEGHNHVRNKNSRKEFLAARVPYLKRQPDATSARQQA